MSKLNEDENVIATQSKDEEKISDDALAIMQKSFDDIDKLQNINVKEDEKIETEVDNNSKSEDEENVVEEIEVKKEKPVVKEDKIRKLQNDKHKAKLAEREALKRVSELEHLLEEALHSGTYHYGKSVSSDIDRAKQKMEIAIENGDNKAFVEANIELTEAIHAANDLKKWETQDKRKWETKEKTTYPPTPIRNVEPEYDDIAQEIAYDWLDSHPYLQPGSREYNAPLARQVNTFINNLDRDLVKNNDMDLYFSEDYFNTIDTFIDDNIRKSKVRSNQTSNSGNHIGGVRHTNGGSVSGGNQSLKTVQLTADEKDWCTNGGISESWLIKHKLLEAEKNRS